MHLPARHLPPGPHSSSTLQVVHLWFLHTSSGPHSLSELQKPATGWQPPATHCEPSGQSMLSLHCTHFLLTQRSFALQSLSPSHDGYLGLPLQPAAASRPQSSENSSSF